jgi:hypothetical protein
VFADSPPSHGAGTFDTEAADARISNAVLLGDLLNRSAAGMKWQKD